MSSETKEDEREISKTRINELQELIKVKQATIKAIQTSIIVSKSSLEARKTQISKLREELNHKKEKLNKLSIGGELLQTELAILDILHKQTTKLLGEIESHKSETNIEDDF